jgi:NAD(P)-dependent dehydrogenase (short-subunit alcohol dehydrogenase family)
MGRSELLSGRTAVVTGATSGIGLATALTLAQNGACVIGIGRNAQRCQKAESEIRVAWPEAKIQFLLADLSSQSQVRSLARDSASELARLNTACLYVRVNNAGTYSQKKVTTTDGIELTFATNHLAPFLLTHKLLPLFKASPTGRVITVSSDSHYNATINPQTAANPSFYFGLQAYARSKLANVLFTAEFNRRMADSNVHAFAVDPGLVKTDIALKGQPLFSRLIWKLRSSAGVEPEVPARTILFLASDNSVQNSPENYWFNSRPKRCSPLAARPDLANELWQVSCKLCGLDEKYQGE